MDKGTLTADRVTLNTEVVAIADVGDITVRGLSRFEFLIAQKNYPDDNLKQERYILSRAVIDPAGLTEDDVADWQKASGPMEINAVALVVNRLSGIGQDAQKEAYKSLRDEPGS